MDTSKTGWNRDSILRPEFEGDLGWEGLLLLRRLRFPIEVDVPLPLPGPCGKRFLLHLVPVRELRPIPSGWDGDVSRLADLRQPSIREGELRGQLRHRLRPDEGVESF